MQKLISIFFLLMLPFLAAAQSNKIGLLLPEVAKGNSGSIDLVLRGSTDCILKFAAAEKWPVTLSATGLVALRIPAREIQLLNTLPGLDFVEYSAGLPQVLNDKMLQNNNVLPVHQGAGELVQPDFGEGVIMGIVDTGIELLHPDFRKEDGSTRILALWDQTQEPLLPEHVPQPYGYGQEWSAADIDADITNHQDADGYYGHGSNVAGVAAGNGLASDAFMGVAPKSDLVIVSSDFNHPNWLLSVAHAVAYIFDIAEAEGKPAVVNLSLGDYLGSHDGKDAAALFIDSLLNAAPGRVVVSAAGNSGDFPNYHLRYEVQAPDTLFSWFKYNPSSAVGQGAVFFEAWADTADLNQISYSLGADVPGQPYQFRGYVPFRNAQQNLNTILTDTLKFQGAVVGLVKTWLGIRGGQYLLQATVTNVLNAGYMWRFAAAGSGQLDIWSSASFGTSALVSQNLPAESAYPAMENFIRPDSLQSIVSSWNCSDQVISVGNYINRDRFYNYLGDTTSYPVTPGAISKNSSRGPTRDNRLKPDLAASGDNTISSGSFAALNLFINTQPYKVSYTGLHNINGGTSLASPVVAGTAALLLSRCPQMDHLTVKSILTGTAAPDSHTGLLPNIRWGHGKLNAFAALNSMASEVEIELSATGFCPGTEVFASADAGFESYLWSNGQSGAQAAFDQPGAVFVEATDGSNCRQFSEPVNIYLLPQPPVPVITAAADTLYAPAAFAYQWYYEGIAIVGATESTLIASDAGAYQVEVFNAQTCGSISEVFNKYPTAISKTERSKIRLYPNPGQGIFSLDGLTAETWQLHLYSAAGALLHQREFDPGAEAFSLDLSGFAAGTYLLKLENHRQQPLNFVVIIE